MKKALLASILAVLLGATAIVAAPGSIPIYQQTVITQPGDYMVTRDIEVSSGYAIEIQSNDVVLDLNGHTIASTSLSDTVLSLDFASRVLVRNGQIKGGAIGIEAYGSAGTATVKIERVMISQSQWGVYLQDVRHFEILSCTFDRPNNTAIVIIGATFPGTVPCSGHIVDNAVVEAGSGIVLYNSRDTIVRGNVLTDNQNGCIGDSGSPTGGGNLIEGNSCSCKVGASFSARGIEINSAAKDRVVGNSIRGCADAGISVIGGNGNVIMDNTISDTAPGSGNGDGIRCFDGYYTLIAGNQVVGNTGCGLRLDAATSFNAYRNNMLRGNGGPSICDSGTANTSEGGNIY